MVVVDARGDMSSGVFGDMMSTYFKGRGGAGIVIDGCMRDRPNVEKLDLAAVAARAGRRTTTCRPASIPIAVNVPIACGGVTVIPGDIIVADDDGVVVLPVSLAEEVIEEAQKHHEWEEFSRMKLMEGAPLQRYYPLHADAWPSTRRGARRTVRLKTVGGVRRALPPERSFVCPAFRPPRPACCSWSSGWRSSR